jgi:hypothetical protein
MIWADRIGLVWALFLGGLAVVMMMVTGKGLTDGGQILAGSIVVPWLLLRALDFIVTGRIRIV